MKGKWRIAWIGLAVLLAIAVLLFLNRGWIRRQFFKPTASTIENGISSQNIEDDTEPIAVVARDLMVPWGIVFLPEGDMLVTERDGVLRRVNNGQTHKIDGVLHRGEGGLLGIVLHPDFNRTRWLYLYLTTSENGQVTNRVERYMYSNNKLSDRTPILENIPGSPVHDGGRLAFGPDKLLYITAGDAGRPESAQDKTSLGGKILRLNDDGSIPADNPFGNAVYSYGHRNPQGLAWDEKGQLWQTEHGPSGSESGYDELNIIKKGANYGWPLIRGDEMRPGMEKPVAHSGTDETWAPAGLAYHNGSLFFGGLRGESLYEAKIRNDNTVSMKAHFREEYGRIRTTIFDAGGFLYITTSNTDGRGTLRRADDKIIRFKRSLFE